MPSFDAVLEPNLVEVKNAVDQAAKEIGTRFDFKGSSARTELKEKELPELDDELARSVSEFDSLAELREDIERRLREQLEELLARVWPELEIVASVGDGLQAVAAMQKHRPDLMFLDVEMPEMSGIDVARHASEQCHVVFVTAYSSYATQAFDVSAVDYVLKPPRAEERAAIDEAMLRALKAWPAIAQGDMEDAMMTLHTVHKESK